MPLHEARKESADARLHGGEGEVDGEGDVVGEVGVGGVGAEVDGGDVGGPGAGEENVVDVVGAIFVVPEIVGGWVRRLAVRRRNDGRR